MTRAPIFDEIERKKKVADIIRDCLKPLGLDDHVDERELHVRDKYIAETTSQQSGLSRAVLDQMFPGEPSPSTLYHYTSLAGLKGIASTGELRLFPIRNRLGQGGELEAFAKTHHLEGYLDTSQGEAFYKELSDGLFYVAMTRVPPKNPSLMWSYFAAGTGVRLEFQVRRKAAELRPVRYETQGEKTLLSEINDALAASGEPAFVPWTISRIGAFYLTSLVATEDEVRLLVKSYDRNQEPIAHDGSSDYWPIPIGVDNMYCALDIKGIHLAPSATLTDVKAAIAGTVFENLPISGP